MEEGVDPDSQYNPQNMETHEFEPIVTEVNLVSSRNFILAVCIGLLLISAVIILIFILNLELVESLILVLIFVVVYSMILFFLLGSKKVRQIERRTLHTIEKPVVKEIPIEVERRVFVDRPVVKEVEVVKEVPVEKKVYIEKPPVIKEVERAVPVVAKRAKLNIPKYDFVGSTETETYHKRNCRLGKLIKKKYKLSSNAENFFIRKKFKPCKVCIKKK